MKKQKRTILIADDTEFNRLLLREMLEEEYRILEAANGEEVVQLLKKKGETIDLLLLDLVMPVMDGFDVLAMMNRNHWIEEIPVIMITAESSGAYIKRAYELGAVDFISRPFDWPVVHRRITNTILLYAKQKKLMDVVADQIIEKEKNNNMMVSILSQIVEFRNGESGLHVLHINLMSEILLNRLMEKTDRYHLNRNAISLISMASSLHDIGKISIPDAVLNKPGRLTPAEFEIIKTHSAVGAGMIQAVSEYKDEILIKYAYEICRWHHERWDGKGYPDGLKEDEIPISAQVVSIADVYDALTSVRCYKKAFSHQKAIEMILNGECGQFNPLLLDCLLECQKEINEALEINSGSGGKAKPKISSTVIREMQELDSNMPLVRTFNRMEEERAKVKYLVGLMEGYYFEYDKEDDILTLPSKTAERLSIPEGVIHPLEIQEVSAKFSMENFQAFMELLNEASPKEPNAVFDTRIKLDGEYVPCEVHCMTLWRENNPVQYAVIAGVLTLGGKGEQDK